MGPANTFAERFRSRGDHLEMIAKMLNAEMKVGTLFPQHPPEDHVHILVQLQVPSISESVACPRHLTIANQAPVNSPLSSSAPDIEPSFDGEYHEPVVLVVLLISGIIVSPPVFAASHRKSTNSISISR
jgi:hypothetical protein